MCLQGDIAAFESFTAEDAAGKKAPPKKKDASKEQPPDEQAAAQKAESKAGPSAGEGKQQAPPPPPAKASGATLGLSPGLPNRRIQWQTVGAELSANRQCMVGCLYADSFLRSLLYRACGGLRVCLQGGRTSFRRQKHSTSDPLSRA